MKKHTPVGESCRNDRTAVETSWPSRIQTSFSYLFFGEPGSAGVAPRVCIRARRGGLLAWLPAFSSQLRYPCRPMSSGDSRPLDPIVPSGAPAPVPEVCDAPVAPPMPEGSEARIGVVYGLAAYTFWGLAVFYFKA